MTPTTRLRILVVLSIAFSASCAGTSSAPPESPTTNAAPAAAAAAPLPDTPTRDDVRQTMSGGNALLGQCLAGAPTGDLNVDVVFVSSGAVQSVAVREPRNDPAATRPETHLDDTAKRCVERELMALRVPPFRNATFNVAYPYRVP